MDFSQRLEVFAQVVRSFSNQNSVDESTREMVLQDAQKNDDFLILTEYLRRRGFSESKLTVSSSEDTSSNYKDFHLLQEYLNTNLNEIASLSFYKPISGDFLEPGIMVEVRRYNDEKKLIMYTLEVGKNQQVRRIKYGIDIPWLVCIISFFSPFVKTIWFFQGKIQRNPPPQ